MKRRISRKGCSHTHLGTHELRASESRPPPVWRFMGLAPALQQTPFMKNRRQTIQYGSIGFVLALGAPLGWLLWRTGGLAMGAELAANGALYLYLLVGTTIAFVAFGAVMGSRIGQLGQSVSSLQSAIVVDPLTKLKNRRYFTERLEQELARASREGSSVVLIVGDLDHFKAINDAHGHQCGDLVLRAVAEIMNECCRTSDSACRIGGEELALILPNTSALEGARVAERVRTAIAQSHIEGPRGEIRPTISLGLAVSGDTLHDVDSLFAAADKAMYRAKLGGRDRVVLDEAIEPLSVLGSWRPAQNVDA
ncbi:MAG: GGDEF domain-containing protein [Myxococcota bacterium]